MAKRICSIEACERPYVARDLCGAHYRRWLTYGDPLGSAPRKSALEKGVPRTCRRCGETKDISLFHKGWSPCLACRRESHYSQGKACEVCGVRLTNGVVGSLCREHWGQRVREAAKPARRKIGGGYVILTGHADHPNARSRGAVLEHVKVMSEMIGRALVPGENVHHINGVRDDNRPENLELWNTHQPKGQRVPDKVQWAKEILSLYEPDALAQPMLVDIEPIRMSAVRGV